MVQLGSFNYGKIFIYAQIYKQTSHLAKLDYVNVAFDEPTPGGIDAKDISGWLLLKNGSVLPFREKQPASGNEFTIISTMGAGHGGSEWIVFVFNNPTDEQPLAFVLKWDQHYEVFPVKSPVNYCAKKQ